VIVTGLDMREEGPFMIDPAAKRGELIKHLEEVWRSLMS
jgi:hypothetical protein